MRKMKAVILSLSMMAGAALVPSQAHAGVPIPCTGDRVIAMPGFEMGKNAKGENLQLAYLINYCVSGKWIVNVTNGSGYYDVNDKMLSEMQKAGAVPPAPSALTAPFKNPKTYWVEWLWLVIIVGAGISVLINGTGAKQDEYAQRAA
ncbi:MAG: hypothetical protein ABL898_19505 [Hyphomicrobiaceae bacterium]